jgi:membrane-bound metal-dependent hydrolase YbcI (DUF457 family)
VLLWYVGLSVLLVANIFRSSGIDFRLVAIGSMLPLVVDLPFGHRAFGHALVFPVVLLALVMLTTIGGSRLTRRQLLCVPIGVFCGLVLSAAFTQDHVFLWPFLGAGFGHKSLLPVWWVVLVEEAIGAFAVWWVVGQFDLYLPGPRSEFNRTGRLREGRAE